MENHWFLNSRREEQTSILLPVLPVAFRECSAWMVDPPALRGIHWRILTYPHMVCVHVVFPTSLACNFPSLALAWRNTGCGECLSRALLLILEGILFRPQPWISQPRFTPPLFYHFWGTLDSATFYILEMENKEKPAKRTRTWLPPKFPSPSYFYRLNSLRSTDSIIYFSRLLFYMVWFWFVIYFSWFLDMTGTQNAPRNFTHIKNNTLCSFSSSCDTLIKLRY